MYKFIIGFCFCTSISFASDIQDKMKICYKISGIVDAGGVNAAMRTADPKQMKRLSQTLRYYVSRNDSCSIRDIESVAESIDTFVSFGELGYNEIAAFLNCVVELN